MALEDLVRGGPHRSVACLGLAAVLVSLAHAETRSYLAKHRPAAELAGLSGLAMRSARPHLLADEKSNRIAVDGAPAAVQDALRLLEDLDVAPRPVELDLELRRGGEVLWRAHLRSFSGVTARAALGPVERLSRVDVRTTATWVDGRHDIRAYGEVTLAGAQLIVRGQARARDGERAVIGRVQPAVGAPLALVVGARSARR